MTPLWWSVDLSVGDVGPGVGVVQRKLLLPATGVFDESTAVGVRGFQAAHGVPVTGVVDEVTAGLLGPQAADVLLPDWWPGVPLLPGEQGWVAVLGAGRDEAWLRRFQGQHGLSPDGVIDESTARLLGALGV